MNALRPASVLAVDDNDVHLYVLTHILKKAGFSVEQASTGTGALASAERHPDLILLDVHLPDLNGFEVCRQLRANPQTAHIPVVFISATWESDGKDWAQYVGGQSFLMYPIQPENLTTVVNGVLAKAAA